MNLYEKILQLQLKINNLSKNGFNTHGKYKYWLLSDIFTQVKKLCKEYNLLITHQDLKEPTIIINRLEKEIEIAYLKEYKIYDLETANKTIAFNSCNSYNIWACGKNTDIAKAKGSAETYAYRYFLMNLLLLSEDELDPDYDKKNNKELKIKSNKLPTTKIISNDYNWTQSKWMPNAKQIESFEYTLLNYPSFKSEFIDPHMEKLNPTSNSEFLSTMGKEWFSEITDRRQCLVKKIEWTKKGMEERQKIALQKWKEKQEGGN